MTVEVGTVWIRRGPVSRFWNPKPVVVTRVSERCVEFTGEEEGGSRFTYEMRGFLELYKKAPKGTPPPVIWPPEARPVDGAKIVRLGDVPVGWLFRDGWEEPGIWNVRENDDRSYEGALVECRPPVEVV